jgi:hypothetical protein
VVTRPTLPSGRVHTLPLPSLAIIGGVTAILDHPRVRHLRVGHRQTTRTPSWGRPATLRGRRDVIALRQRQTIALGALADRAVLSGERLVAAEDQVGHRWWISAESVWSDSHAADHPEHPRPIGLATAATRHAALLRGLSDRLGWEAVLEFERGADLPVASAVREPQAVNAIVLDGRLDHDVPTVVVLAADTMRWGAGATWDGAMRRALYGDDHSTDPSSELAAVCSLLAAAGLAVAGVDLGTARLNAAGVARCSVQLLAGNGSVRSWDAH